MAKKGKIYPDHTLEEALIIPKGIFELGSINEVRRLTLFDHIGKAPESGPSRALISTCNKYGLIKGNAASEHLSVTELGQNCVDSDISAGIKFKSLFKAGIENIEPFNTIYNKYVGSKMPARTVLLDELKALKIKESDIDAVADRFIENCNFVGVVKVLSGAERLIAIDQVIEESSPAQGKGDTILKVDKIVSTKIGSDSKEGSKTNFDKVCFYITAIGDDDSEERKHSDLFLGSIVEPALEVLDFDVIRADKIAEPGMITSQVIDYIFNSKLVIADLSFHNPNVFYELALRHITRKPTVQIVRKGDRIPFDINQFRTIVLDTSSIYALVPKLESYKTDIRNYARTILEDPALVDNPVIARYPSIHIEIK